MLQGTPLRDTRTSKSLQLIRLFVTSKQYKTAEKHLQDYISKNPECPEGYKILSQIHEEQGETEQAFQAYEKSLRLKENQQQSLSSSFEYGASPNSKFSTSGRHSGNFNMSTNSKLDTSLTSQTNGSCPVPVDVKIDYQEFEKIFQKFSTENLVKDLFEKLSFQFKDSFSYLSQKITNVETSVRTLDSKYETFLQKLDTLKNQVEVLSNIVQESLERDEEDDYEEEEEYENDSGNAAYNAAPKQNLGDIFKKSLSNWECPTCGISNEENEPKCVSCEANNPNSKVVPPSVSNKFSCGVQPQTIPALAAPVQTSINQTPVSGLGPAQSSLPSLLKSNPPMANFSFSQTAGELPKFGQVSLPPSGTIFGSPVVNGTGESSVGLSKPPVTNKTSPFSGNSFGSFFQPNPQANSSTLSSIFGKPPETTSLFGKPVESTGLFGKPVESTGLFGKPVENTGLFGKPLSSSATSLGAKPLQNTSTLFSNPTPLFGIKPQQQPSAPASNLFGSTSKPFETGNQSSFSFSNISFTSQPKPEQEEQKEDDGHPEDHEPEGVYKLPNVKLPDHYDAVTGEEEEDVLFEQRAKLHNYRDGEFKERGLGPFKILQNRKTGKIRILMRREHVHKVCLNVRLEDVNKLEIVQNKFLRFSALDFSESEAATGIFLLRFGSLDQVKKLKEMIETLVKNPAGDHSETESKKCEESDIQFINKVDPTPEQLKKIQELKLPLNFYALENSLKPCKGCRGCTDAELVYEDASTKNNGPMTDDSSGDFFSKLVSNLNIPSSSVDNINTSRPRVFENGDGDEEDVVTTDYTSAKSKMLPTDFVVKTGEEEDEVLFSERSKLFRLDGKEYKERGVGQMKILKNKKTGFIRLLMRREQVHKVVCNHGIKGLNVKLHNTLDRAVNWAACDFSDSSEGSKQVFLLKFKNGEQAKKFADKIRELQETL